MINIFTGVIEKYNMGCYRKGLQKIRISWNVGLILLAVFAGCISNHVFAIKMDIELGFEGYCKNNSWIPVVFFLENEEDKSFTGTVTMLPPEQSLAQFPQFIKSVSIPGKSKKKFSMQVQISGYQDKIKFILKNNRDTVVLEKEVPRRFTNVYDPMIVILTEEKFGLGLVSTKYGQGDIKITYANERNLPDHWKGFESVDLLIVSNFLIKRLDQDQINALITWVNTGGRIVVSSGSNSRKLLHPEFDKLLPVKIQENREIPSLDIIGNYYGEPIQIDRPAIINHGLITSGKSRIQWNDIPLMVESQKGLGTVTYLAFDIDKPPIQGWNGNDNFWKSFLTGNISGFQNFTPVNQGLDQQIQNALLSIPSVGIPSLAFITYFLLSYIIILGPVNYFWLKRKKKLEFAWVTIPVIVIVFTLGAYVIGLVTKGVSLLMEDISILKMGEGGDIGKIDHYFGLFSPRRTEYTIGVNNPLAIVEELRGNAGTGSVKYADIVYTDTMKLMDVPINMWSMKLFHSESPVNIGNGIESNLVRYRDRVQGVITNKTPFSITNSHLVVLDSFKSITMGNITSGKSVNVDFVLDKGMNISAVYSTQTAHPPYDQWKNVLVNSIFNNQMYPGQPKEIVILEGYIDNPPDINLEFKYHPRRIERLTLMLASLPVVIKSGLIEFKQGLGDSTVIEHIAKVFNFNPTSQWARGTLEIGDGYCVLQYTLGNIQKSMRNAELSLQINQSQYPPPPNVQWRNWTIPSLEMSIYNWSSNEWEKVDISKVVQPNQLSTNYRVTIPQAEKYIRTPLGICKLRVAANPIVNPQGIKTEQWVNRIRIQELDLNVTFEQNE